MSDSRPGGAGREPVAARARRRSFAVVGACGAASALAAGVLASAATSWPLPARLALAATAIAPLPFLARPRGVSAEAARVAVLDERRRIARDVHDVLAHTLTILMVHLNSARLQVLDDPEGTAGVLDDVADYGRLCLDEIRATVGLLSERPALDRAAGPIEVANAIEDLVASYRGAGVDVELRLDVGMEHMGRLARAPGRVWASGYRIVQESLANATKHAPGAAIEVWIGVDDDGLHMRCTNTLVADATGLELPSGGNGIPGMRERVGAVGGSFDAGPDGRDWVVRADLPIADGPVEPALARARSGRAS